MFDAELAAKCDSRIDLSRRDEGRPDGRRDDAIAQHLVRDAQEEGRVHARGERDKAGTEVAQGGAECVEFGEGFW